MITDGSHVAAAMIIAKYNFHSDFNIEELLVHLIEDQTDTRPAKNLVKGHVSQQKRLINILVQLHKIKDAVKMVKYFNLNH